MKNNEDVLSLVYKKRDSIEYTINEFGRVTILELQDKKLQKLLRKIKFKIPMYKKTTLDEFSTEVFFLIDGRKTVKEIGELLESKFGEKVNPLYERLLLFLNHVDVNLKYIEKVNNKT